MRSLQHRSESAGSVPCAAPSLPAKYLGASRSRMAPHRVAAQTEAAAIFAAAHHATNQGASDTARALKMKSVASAGELLTGAAAVTVRDLVAGSASVRRAVALALLDLGGDGAPDLLLSTEILAATKALGDAAEVALAIGADGHESPEECRAAIPIVHRGLDILARAEARLRAKAGR